MSGIKYKQREIVLVPFPYSDLSSIKKRPVLVVSNNHYNQKYNDVIVVVITSVHRQRDQYSISLTNDDLEYGMLPEKSMIKAHKIFTIDKSRIIKKFSVINKKKLKEVHSILKDLFSIDNEI